MFDFENKTHTDLALDAQAEISDAGTRGFENVRKLAELVRASVDSLHQGKAPTDVLLWRDVLLRTENSGAREYKVVADAVSELLVQLGNLDRVHRGEKGANTSQAQSFCEAVRWISQREINDEWHRRHDNRYPGRRYATS